MYTILGVMLIFEVFSIECVFPEFNDQLHYSIVWNDVMSEELEQKNSLEKVFITTNENERYQCLLPTVKTNEEDDLDDSNGPSPEVLLADVLLGNLKKCSYRLEPYWTYELCHGENIQQFHEEKNEEGMTITNEFVLGKLKKAEVREILSPSKPISVPGKKKKVPTRKVNNRDTPYYSVEMGNGTPCDLSNGKPRKTTVLYMCHPGANNELLSIKETTTCEYEAIVLTPYLCGNPAYMTKEKEVHSIQCHSMQGSPRLPKKLSEYTPHQSRPRIELPSRQNNEGNVPEDHGRSQFKPTDKSINLKFLSGDYCLHGGTGWWRYEFCNGKHINQYHVETNGQKTLINVGRWDKNKHIDHIKTKQLKAKGTKHVNHYYFDGDICDLTAQPRIAQIMLICKEGEGQPLSIYMTEDKPCSYKVGVESPILCPYVAGANEYGIFEEK